MIAVAPTVHHGDVVTKRGGRFIRCGKRMTPFGVYVSGYDMLILTESGYQNIRIPSGVQVGGLGEVNVTR